jgi:hypothetical protein
LLALTAGCGAGSDTATLKPTDPQTTMIGPLITTQDTSFHNAVYLDHPGAEIRVLDVDALTSPNVTFLGAVTVWPRDLKGENVGAGPSFPPPGIRRSHAIDQVVPPAETAFVPSGWNGPASLAIAFGFRLNGAENGAVNGMRVVYEVDGKRNVKLFRIAMIACPPPKGCGGSGQSDDPDFTDKVLRQYGLLPD